VTGADASAPAAPVALEAALAYCAVCDSDRDVRRAMRLTNADPESRGTYDLVDCVECGFRFVHPTPSNCELTRYYASAFETTYGNYVEAKQLKMAHFRHQLSLVAAHLPGAGSRILDVGCASGFLLEVAEECGWRPEGVELNPKARDAAGERVRPRIHIGTLEDFLRGGPAQRFELITMFDVLEHVGDPRSILSASHALLESSGHLVVQVPCIDSLGARLMGRRWYHYAAPSHLSYFNESSFTRLARSAGFEVVASRWTRKLLTLGYFRDQVTLLLWGRRIKALRMGRLDDLRIPLPMGERLLVLRPKPGEFGSGATT
jgi:cyclopropane fatty-acyl-phospholipid synthase-like methyltransferase